MVLLVWNTLVLSILYMRSAATCQALLRDLIDSCDLEPAVLTAVRVLVLFNRWDVTLQGTRP